MEGGPLDSEDPERRELDRELEAAAEEMRAQVEAWVGGPVVVVKSPGKP